MTYRKEVEKTVKSYFSQSGYKYYPKKGFFVISLSTDIIRSIGFAYENHGKSRYYYLRAFVSVASKSLDEILFEVTDGRIDYTDFHIGPIYQCSIKKLTYGDNDYTHCEFIGNRSMEDNLADLDRMYKNDVQKIYDTYNTQKSIFTCAAHEESFPFNPVNTPSLFYYGPLNYYFAGQFDKAFEFIDNQIKLDKANIKELGPYEEAVNNIKTYEIYRKNLKKWIDERRQFKVDDEYIPIFNEQEANSLSESLQKMKSIVGKLLKNE